MSFRPACLAEEEASAPVTDELLFGVPSQFLWALPAFSMMLSRVPNTAPPLTSWETTE